MAFVLRPNGLDATRLLVREPDLGWRKLAAPRRSALLRAFAALGDFVIGEPRHFAMVRKMTLGIRERAELPRYHNF